MTKEGTGNGSGNMVYVVTSGNYSDYGINRIFSTRELADQYVKSRDAVDRYDRCNVEEWVLDRETVEYGPVVSWSWKYPQDEEYRRDFDHDIPPHPKVNVTRWGKKDGCVTISVMARASQEDKALKALRDRRAQWLMENMDHSPDPVANNERRSDGGE